ncbi:MAG: hypothetical protein A2Y64_04375 [Candidatus Coatesbacteria bacterium RBG_13_66_14]|uniref:Uncharacterized protein n=1 Tax=Candidatus Coatesbacteria bacterium RBG_13_66_14 TaxID=1817816 RepID=A0A1F5F5B9_9BACT|nr:MAG: hypothetical protein A2Y64_04375 [Candidatus Coatesbacteria bacterium RBG_13_66_14]
MKPMRWISLVPVIALLALLGCRTSDELVIELRAEGELDPEAYPTLAVQDFAYGGEIEFGLMAAERVRDRISAGGRFAVVRELEMADPSAPLFDLAGDDLDAALARTREAGAAVLVTGKVVFSRRNAQDYAERLAESYDVEESESPSMAWGRSWEADARRTGTVYVLEISVRAYDAATGEVVWRRTSSERVETSSTNRTPTRSELMGVFNSLVQPVVEDLRLGLEPHLRAETRYVVP